MECQTAANEFLAEVRAFSGNEPGKYGITHRSHKARKHSPEKSEQPHIWTICRSFGDQIRAIIKLCNGAFPAIRGLRKHSSAVS